MAGRIKRTSRNALSRLRGAGASSGKDVPGPSSDPSSNLVMADVTMRMASYIMRNAIERSFLKGRYGKDTARKIIKNKGVGQTLASVAIARFAISSLPGAVIVTTGMAAKVLLDRSKARHAAQAEGDEELLEQARGE